MIVSGFILFSGMNFVNASVVNGALTANDIEFCHEVYQQYKTLGLKWFLENYHYSIEARVCVSLYEDPVWEYQGTDRLDKLMQKSKYYVQLEIEESKKEALSGQVDPTPAGMIVKSNTITKIASDGTIAVKIETTDPTKGEYLGLNLIFKDLKDNPVKQVNYDLKVTQNGDDFLVVKSQHTENGMAEHWTRPLSTDDPVDVEVTVLGIGLPKDRESWSEPWNSTVTFNSVPEFGIWSGAALTVSIFMTLLVIKSRIRIAY